MLRKDITRFCPVWILYLVFGLMFAFSLDGNSISYSNTYNLAGSMATLGIVNLIYGFIVAMLLFGDLFKSRLCNGLHALAPRRESWFATHCLAGLLFSLVPNLILTLIFLLYTYSELWFISLLWLLAMTLQYLFFFGLGVFSVMCCGNRFAATAVYGLINFGSLIAYWFTVTFYEPLLYGVEISGTIFTRLCPVVQIVSMHEIFYTIRYYIRAINGDLSIIGGADFFATGFCEWYMLIIGIIGVALMGLALLLYRRRKLECAGNLMAFRWMRPVFAVVFTLSVGALMEMIGGNMIGADYIFLAIGIVVGYFTGQMLLQRTVAVFRLKTFVGCAAVGLALLLSIGLMFPISFGFERWVPEPENVQSITFSHNMIYYHQQKTSCDAPALIEALTDIHRDILEEGEITEYDRYELPTLRLTYKMKDGRDITRSYSLRKNGEAYQKLQRFFYLPENVLGYSDWEDYLDSIDSVSVQSGIFTGEEARQLMAAVKADFENDAFFVGRYSSAMYCSLAIVTDKSTARYLNIPYACENTIAWLKANMS